MGVFFDHIFLDVLFLLPILYYIASKYIKYKYSYWKRCGIPQMPPTFPFGNQKDMILRRTNMGKCFEEIHNYFRDQKIPLGGYYNMFRPDLMVVDPEIIKHILIKDFQYFTDRQSIMNTKNDPLSGHLFLLRGTKWRNLRIKLTPTFTSGKMKMMFHTMLATSDELINIFQKGSETGEPLDVKDILARFTTDVIGSCAFGIECNSLKDPENDFRKYSKSISTTSFIGMVKRILVSLLPQLAKVLKVGLTPKDTTDFFMNVVKSTVSYREEQKIFRKDFLQLLIELKNKGTISEEEWMQEEENDEDGGADTKRGLTIEEIAAQCFLFFLAGFETSSTTLAFTFFELTQNIPMQEKLREEILTVLKKYNGEVTYDGIMEMEYLDQILNETLRKYPIVPMLLRKCTKDYIVPNTSYKIQKDATIRISVLGLHKDPQYYPNPEEFIPERFTEEEKNKRPSCVYLPFGDGPRHCIGLRFGLMQAKVGLVVLMKDYKFTLNSKTKIPLEVDPNSVFLSSRGNILLNVEKIQK